MKTNFQAVWWSARPPFLLLTVSIIVLAIGLAWFKTQALDFSLILLVAIGGVAAHAAVNLLNEAHDAKTGLDDFTERTPFSGGSGALQRWPQALKTVEFTGYAMLVLVLLIGLYLMDLRGGLLALFGGVGVVLVLAYTPLLTRSAWACLVAPGTGFGLLMFPASYYVLTAELDLTVFLLALIPFFLVNNLLLINQFPDYHADKRVGRNHLIIQAGLLAGIRVARLFIVLPFVVLGGMVLSGFLPLFSLIGFLVLPLAVWLFMSVGKLEQKARDGWLPVMGINVALTLSLPVLIAIGFFLANSWS
jgi:1,4-dihydroxy-2-naphthoate octaprenyltransferase